MKKPLLSIIALLIANTLSAQWTTSGGDIYNSYAGNVGIGTTVPDVKLSVTDNSNTFAVAVRANYATTLLGLGNTSSLPTIQAFTSVGGVTNLLVNPSGGNIGVGTTTPSEKLHVNGSGNTATLISTATADADAAISLRQNASGFDAGVVATGSSGNRRLGFFADDVSSGNYAERMSIIDGNVGIGTTDPQGYKLAVDGSMVARSVKVATVPNWSDYVFAPAYALPTLKETEQYIKVNRRLPEMPSAEEVKKNGMDLANMNAMLLKKIEELTLYMIEMDKKLSAQDAYIKAMWPGQKIK